jgi:hypothetical protein
MIYTAPSSTETVYSEEFAAGLTGAQILFGISDAAGNAVLAASQSGQNGVTITQIAVLPDATARYKATFTTPASAGDYVPQWTVAGTVYDDSEVLRVTTAAPLYSAAANLTDLATVRDYMQKGGAGQQTGQDQTILDLIPRASRAIQRYTRTFAPAETNVTYIFTWRERGLLSLNPWFVRNVTAVSLGSDTSSPQALVSADWALRPKPSEDGVYTHLKIAGSNLYESNLELLDMTYANAVELEVAVTGDWGYVAVPEDVRHWASVTVVEWIRKDVSAFSTQFDANEDRLDRPEELPRAVKVGLRDYRRDDTPKLPVLSPPRSRPAEAI